MKSKNKAVAKQKCSLCNKELEKHSTYWVVKSKDYLNHSKKQIVCDDRCCFKSLIDLVDKGSSVKEINISVESV